MYEIVDPSDVEDVHSCVAHWKATMIDTTLGSSRSKLNNNYQRTIEL